MGSRGDNFFREHLTQQFFIYKEAYYEVEAAMQEELEKGKSVLFPIRLDEHIFETDVDWAKSIRQRHIGDFTDEARYDVSFERLLRDLREG